MTKDKKTFEQTYIIYDEIVDATTDGRHRLPPYYRDDGVYEIGEKDKEPAAQERTEFEIHFGYYGSGTPTIVLQTVRSEMRDGEFVATTTK